MIRQLVGLHGSVRELPTPSFVVSLIACGQQA